MNTLREISLTTFRSTQQLKSKILLDLFCVLPTRVDGVGARECDDLVARAIRHRRELGEIAKVNKVVRMIEIQK